jgi:diguanylate cyclase (GGDEF)-like protein
VKRDPRQRSIEAEHAQLRGFSRSIAEVEWLLLILVMMYLFLTQPQLARQMPVIAVLAGFTLFVLVFRYSPLLASRTGTKIAVEIAAMVAFLTLVLRLAGTGAQPLVNLYLLPIVTAALVLGRRATALVLLLVSGLYLLFVLPSLSSGTLSAQIATQVAGVLVPFVLVAFLTTLLAENIQGANERMRALADRDGLTGLYNMRAFLRLAGREHDVASRMERPYSVLMIDLDRLKGVNDAFGHEAGNRALQLVAQALQRLTRASDIAARYGGDEFVVYLDKVDKATGEEIAQRVRNVVFSTTMEIDASMVRLKVSVGVGTFPDDGRALPDVIGSADRAMYKDKDLRKVPKAKPLIRRR